MADDEISLQHVEVCRLEPGDLLVYRSPETLSVERQKQVAALLRHIIERSGLENQVFGVVIDAGADLSVLRPGAKV